jgi:hypothetical protein
LDDAHSCTFLTVKKSSPSLSSSPNSNIHRGNRARSEEVEDWSDVGSRAGRRAGEGSTGDFLFLDGGWVDASSLQLPQPLLLLLRSLDLLFQLVESPGRREMGREGEEEKEIGRWGVGERGVRCGQGRDESVSERVRVPFPIPLGTLSCLLHCPPTLTNIIIVVTTIMKDGKPVDVLLLSYFSPLLLPLGCDRGLWGHPQPQADSECI